MQALAEEWRRRDREREALVKKKVESLPAYTNSHINICLSFTERSLLLTSPHLCVFAGGGVQPAGGAASEDFV